MAKFHRLKIWPSVFEDVRREVKTFELRKNDRGYAIGDCLVLDAWSPERNAYVNDERSLIRLVTYVLHGGRFGLEEGYVALGIAPVGSLDALYAEELLRELAPLRPVDGG